MPSAPGRRATRSKWKVGAVVALALATVAAACGSPSNPATLNGGPGGPPTDATTGTACMPGHEGCPCSTPGQTVDCGKVANDYGGYITCSEGTSTCTNGEWGACVGSKTITKSKRGVTIGDNGHVTDAPRTPQIRDAGFAGGTDAGCPQDPENPCDPNCPSTTFDNGSNAPTDAGLLINEAGVSIPPTTSTGTGSGDGGACTGLQCQIDWGCPMNSQTTLTGTVYDPAMQNPLYNAYVYIPVDPNPADLPAFSTGASCDACNGTKLNAVAVTQTDVHGNFTLTNVPTTAKAPNNQIPLVVQMGKWRRVQMLATVPDCQSTAVPNANSRLPQSKFDGYNNQADIPRMALASGSADPFECMMLRMGIDPGEFQLPGTGNRRIDYFHANGLQYQGGNTPDYSQLVGSTSTLDGYDVVLLPCEGEQDDGNDTYADNVAAYTLAGGRMFTTHFGYTWLATPTGGTAHATNPVTGNPNIFYPVATWNWDDENGSCTGQIDTGFPKGATFETWMDNLPAPNAGVVSSGAFTITDPRHDISSVNAAYATEWIHDKDWESPKPLSMTFNTPLGAGIGDAGADGGAAVCGRVVYSDFHVTTSATGGGWNNNCASNNDCGYGSTCTGGSLGTCTPETCNTVADCPDTTYTCSGAGSGTCTLQSPQCWWGGQCISNNCNGNHQCTCSSSSQCHGSPCVGGVCVSSNQACTSSSQCPGSNETCSGTSGTCTHSCNTNSDCTGGELCVSNQCTGCESWRNCPSQQCNGVMQGTCSGNSNQFPNVCTRGPLDAQESALEFMLLDLTACVSPDSQPPPPPPNTTIYNPVSFTMTFQSNCPAGTRVKWRELDWQASIPNTASIVFSGQTADPPADGGAVNWSGVQSVQIADATTTTPNLPTGWNAALIDTAGADAGAGVGAFSSANPPVQSADDLLLTITLNPTTDQSQSPTLIQWQVTQDCPPSE